MAAIKSVYFKSTGNEDLLVWWRLESKEKTNYSSRTIGSAATKITESSRPLNCSSEESYPDSHCSDFWKSKTAAIEASERKLKITGIEENSGVPSLTIWILIYFNSCSINFTRNVFEWIDYCCVC